MIQAIVFDFDGLIVDTEAPARRAWQLLYEEHGHSLDHELWEKYFLDDSFDPLEHLSGLCAGSLDSERANDRRNDIKTRLCDAEALREGVRECIDEAHELGLRLAVASSSRRAWVERHLLRLDILHHFEVVSTREDVDRAKPAPDLYTLTAHRLKLQPSELLAIEDSPNGLKAAIAAGLSCIIIPNEVTRSMTFADPHRRFSSLSDIRLQELVRLAP